MLTYSAAGAETNPNVRASVYVWFSLLVALLQQISFNTSLFDRRRPHKYKCTHTRVVFTGSFDFLETSHETIYLSTAGV